MSSSSSSDGAIAGGHWQLQVDWFPILNTIACRSFFREEWERTQHADDATRLHMIWGLRGFCGAPLRERQRESKIAGIFTPEWKYAPRAKKANDLCLTVESLFSNLNWLRFNSSSTKGSRLSQLLTRGAMVSAETLASVVMELAWLIKSSSFMAER